LKKNNFPCQNTKENFFFEQIARKTIFFCFKQFFSSGQNDKEKKMYRPCHFHKVKKSLNTFFSKFFLSLFQGKNTFVSASIRPRPVRRDWLIHLIGIASKVCFSPCHIVKIRS